MSHTGRKLGILLSAAPHAVCFEHGVRLAGAALARGVDVYLYCIDDAVAGLSDSRLQRLRDGGLKVFACAEAARRRGVATSDDAVFAGLGALGDVIAACDRFVSFNGEAPAP